MNLGEVRTKFRALSGRHDLVTALGADNGADFFINAGGRYLDRMAETQKSWASCFRFAEISQFAAHIPYCRAIKEVWAATTTSRWQLEKKSLQDLIAGYLTALPTSRELGTPLYYAPALTRHITEGVTSEDFEGFVGWIDVSAGNAHEWNSILLNVPVSEKTMLDVRGLFYSPELSEDTDENYWSAVHPNILIMAAMREAEVFNRNTQGVNDWNNAIAAEIQQLDMDLVEELIAEVSEMEG